MSSTREKWKTYPVRLECGDTVYFKIAPPRPGEKLWCTRCTEYVTVGEPGGAETLGFDPEYMWEGSKKGSWYYGACVETECEGFERRRATWHKLKEVMEGHHLRVHGTSTLLTRMEKANARVERDAEPPF